MGPAGRSSCSRSGPARAPDDRSSSSDDRRDARGRVRRCGSDPARRDGCPNADHPSAAPHDADLRGAALRSAEPPSERRGPEAPAAWALAGALGSEPGSAQQALRRGALPEPAPQAGRPARALRQASRRRRRPQRPRRGPLRLRRERGPHGRAARRPGEPDARAPARWRADGRVVRRPTSPNRRSTIRPATDAARKVAASRRASRPRTGQQGSPPARHACAGAWSPRPQSWSDRG